jgi:hypothetical protein
LIVGLTGGRNILGLLGTVDNGEGVATRLAGIGLSAILAAKRIRQT